MKILFITAFPPCEKTAGQDYTRRLILDLISRGHRVDLIYAEFPNHEVQLSDEVKILRTIHPSLGNCVKHFRYHPFFTKRFDIGSLKYIQSISSNYDMLYFDFSQVHIYSLYVKHPYKVLMAHDVICQKYARRSGRANVDFIKRTEGKVLYSAKEIYTFSDKDSEILKRNYGVVSIPVNFYLKTSRFSYEDEKITGSFCFYGAWNREENTEAILFFKNKVLPLVNKSLKFKVIGGGMDIELAKELQATGRFEILGFVDDPVKSISECQALIAPLHQGAGVKVKVVDALTSGTPVIGTDVTFEGLQDNSETKLFHLAKEPNEFADIVNNWIDIAKASKQAAANEFFDRYNTNHFPDYLTL